MLPLNLNGDQKVRGLYVPAAGQKKLHWLGVWGVLGEGPGRQWLQQQPQNEEHLWSPPRVWSCPCPP